MSSARMKTSLGAMRSPESQLATSTTETCSSAASRSSLPSVARARRRVRMEAVSFDFISACLPKKQFEFTQIPEGTEK
jgi:hypothetical protein